MKYQIFELETPDVLSKHIPDGYYMKHIQGIVLQSVSIDRFSFEEKHDSVESAMSEIQKFSEDLKGKSLTIIPIVNVGYNGEVN